MKADPYRWAHGLNYAVESVCPPANFFHFFCLFVTYEWSKFFRFGLVGQTGYPTKYQCQKLTTWKWYLLINYVTRCSFKVLLLTQTQARTLTRQPQSPNLISF